MRALSLLAVLFAGVGTAWAYAVGNSVVALAGVFIVVIASSLAWSETERRRP